MQQLFHLILSQGPLSYLHFLKFTFYTYCSVLMSSTDLSFSLMFCFIQSVVESFKGIFQFTAAVFNSVISVWYFLIFSISFSVFLFSFLFFIGCTDGIGEFLGQGSNTSYTVIQPQLQECQVLNSLCQAGDRTCIAAEMMLNP